MTSGEVAPSEEEDVVGAEAVELRAGEGAGQQLRRPRTGRRRPPGGHHGRGGVAVHGPQPADHGPGRPRRRRADRTSSSHCMPVPSGALNGTVDGQADQRQQDQRSQRMRCGAPSAARLTEADRQGRGAPGAGRPAARPRAAGRRRSPAGSGGPCRAAARARPRLVTPSTTTGRPRLEPSCSTARHSARRCRVVLDVGEEVLVHLQHVDRHARPGRPATTSRCRSRRRRCGRRAGAAR